MLLKRGCAAMANSLSIAKEIESISGKQLRKIQFDTLHHYHSDCVEHKAVFFELPTGSGKSLLASAIARLWLNRGNRVAILTETKQLQNQYTDRNGITARFDIAPIYSYKGQEDETQARRERDQNIEDFNAGRKTGVFSMSGYFNYLLNEMIRAPHLIIVDEAHNLAETARKCKSLEIPLEIVQHLSFIDPDFRNLVSELAESTVEEKEDIRLPKDDKEAIRVVWHALGEMRAEMRDVRNHVLNVLSAFRSVCNDCDGRGEMEFDLNRPKFYHVIKSVKNNCSLLGTHTGIDKEDLRAFIEIVDRILAKDEREEFVPEFMSSEGAVDSIGKVIPIILPTLRLFNFKNDLEHFDKIYPNETAVMDKTGIAYNKKNRTLSVCRLYADIDDTAGRFTGTKQTIFMSGTILGAKQYAEELGLASQNVAELTRVRQMEPVLYSGQRILIPLDVCSLKKVVVAEEPYEGRLLKSFAAILLAAKKHDRLAVLLASIDDMKKMASFLQGQLPGIELFKVGGGGQTPEEQQATIGRFIQASKQTKVLLTVRWEGIDLKGIEAVVLHRVPYGITERHKILERKYGENTFLQMINPETLRKTVQGCGRANRDNLAHGIGVYYLVDKRFKTFFDKQEDLPQYLSLALKEGLERTSRVSHLEGKLLV
jgi:Rad3-related DNA helicase